MYKEFRELSRVGAVEALYQDLAARHRARFRSVHVSSGKARRVVCIKAIT
jgi:ribosomal protein L20A (L18A)